MFQRFGANLCFQRRSQPTESIPTMIFATYGELREITKHDQNWKGPEP